MEQIFDFMKAAWPWMAMGLLLAVFFAMDASRKRDKKTYEYGALGMCFGAAFGTSLGINPGVSMMAGLVLGTYLCPKKEKNNNEDEK